MTTYESGYYTRVAAHRASRWVRVAAVCGAAPVCAGTALLGANLPDPVTIVGAVVVAAGALCFLIGLIGSGFATIIWLTRARDVCDDYYAYEHRFRAGWAISGWFLRIGAFFIPRAIVADVVRATELAAPGSRGPLRPTINLWWGTWLAAQFLLAAPILALILLWHSPAWVEVLVGVVVGVATATAYLVAARSLTTIMTTVARWQDEDIHARYRAAHPPPPPDPSVWQRPGPAPQGR